MRSMLSFKTNNFKDCSIDKPKGIGICQFLRDKLASHDEITPATIENYRDIAWSLECMVRDKTLYFFVGYLGLEYSDWQLIICSAAGWIKRLFGHHDIVERRVLAREIHACLASDMRFTQLRWYEEFTNRATDRWFSSPD